MAQRFGGKFSPDGAGKNKAEAREAKPRDWQGATVDPVGARSNVLFVPPVVLVATTISDGALPMATGLIGAALLLGGAWILRDGLRAEAAYHARKVAKRPAIPRKIFAAVLTGLGAAAAVWAHGDAAQIVAPVIFGLAAGGVHLAAFGFDPLRDKGLEGIDSFQQDRVARAVDEAETHLTQMTDAMKRAGDRQMMARLERFQTTARDLFRTVEEDPRDLTAARKYLGVYLMGARDATTKFADIYARTRDVQARDDYAALLDDLEQNFASRTRKMLLEDRTDLTVEIDVLRDRLNREGVRIR